MTLPPITPPRSIRKAQNRQRQQDPSSSLHRSSVQSIATTQQRQSMDLLTSLLKEQQESVDMQQYLVANPTEPNLLSSVPRSTPSQDDDTATTVIRQGAMPSSTSNQSTPRYWQQHNDGTLRVVGNRDQLLWTKAVLDWIQSEKIDANQGNEAMIDVFHYTSCLVPRELQQLPLPNSHSSRNRNKTQQRNPASPTLVLVNDWDQDMEVVGTLHKIWYCHCHYNIGPLPEPILAWLTIQIVRSIQELHTAGVSFKQGHLHLDSFWVVC